MPLISAVLDVAKNKLQSNLHCVYGLKYKWFIQIDTTGWWRQVSLIPFYNNNNTAIIDQHPCSDSGTLTTAAATDRTGVSRASAIVAAVVTTALVVVLVATVAIVIIVLRWKKNTKQGISNPAYGK